MRKESGVEYTLNHAGARPSSSCHDEGHSSLCLTSCRDGFMRTNDEAVICSVLLAAPSAPAEPVGLDPPQFLPQGSKWGTGVCGKGLTSTGSAPQSADISRQIQRRDVDRARQISRVTAKPSTQVRMRFAWRGKTRQRSLASWDVQMLVIGCTEGRSTALGRATGS